MTSPPGYERLGSPPPPVQTRIWRAIREHGGDWTAAEIIEAASASASQVKRLIRALRQDGWVDCVAEAEGLPAPTPAAYRLVRDPGPLPPQLVGVGGTAGVRDRMSDLTGADLRAERRRRGWTWAAMARALAVSHQTARRWETLGILPAAVAEKVRGLMRG